LKNQSDSLCYQSEKQLKELDNKLEKDDKSKIENLIQQLKEAVQTENSDSMKELSSKLQNELMEIGKKIYSNTQKNESDEKNSNKNESVIDADFSETK
jgi:molecular chaperone DnaK